jgi:hypothetical protein
MIQGGVKENVLPMRASATVSYLICFLPSFLPNDETFGLL